MATFVVRSNIQHDGKTILPGQKISFDDSKEGQAAARALHNVGAILTEEEMAARKEEADRLAEESGIVEQKDAEIEALRAELEKAKTGGKDK